MLDPLTFLHGVVKLLGRLGQRSTVDRLTLGIDFELIEQLLRPSYLRWLNQLLGISGHFFRHIPHLSRLLSIVFANDR